MNNKTLALSCAAVLALAGCGAPANMSNVLDNAPAAQSSSNQQSAPQVSITPGLATVDMGDPQGKTISINLLAPVAGTYTSQAVIHRWVARDIFEYVVTLSNAGQTLSNVTVPASSGTAKAIFSHLKPGRSYQVVVVAKGNIGGTEATTVLNTQNQAVGVFDFTPNNDIDNFKSATIPVVLDSVRFDGTGDASLRPVNGEYLEPEQQESGEASYSVEP